MSPLGATFNGVVVPDLHMVTFGLMIVSLGLWVFVRWRQGWDWHRTAFDIVFVLWIAVFAISILANMESARRSLIGLWYMLTYIAVWYVLHDFLANGGVSRKQLIDAFLNAGIMIILFSFFQIANAGELVAPVSLIGNTNALGAVLLGMTPFAVARAVTANHRIGRIGWGLYSLFVIVNLLLTLSRGAWLGMFGSLSVLAVLLLVHYNMLSWSAIKRWWANRSRLQKRLLGGFSLSVFVVFLVVMGLLINSFSISVRRPELRTRLWNSALEQFAEKPLTGHGLYTFGQDYPLSIQIPGQQSHAHAHSVPLNILAEMGLVGFVVFVCTVAFTVYLIKRRWSDIDTKERLIWIPAIAALAGFSIHHLFDLPSMMPVVALVALFILVLVCAPHYPQPMTAWWRRLGHPIGMVVLWGGLLATGIWSTGVYQQYLDAMRISFGHGEDISQEEQLANYRETATQLNRVVAQDPLMPIYWQQQGFVWGLLASGGDTNAINEATRSYEQFLLLEPNHTISWANLSVLYWYDGDTETALNLLDRAQDLSPTYGYYQRLRQVYLGEMDADTVEMPVYMFNQNFARFEFLREPLPQAFLPLHVE